VFLKNVEPKNEPNFRGEKPHAQHGPGMLPSVLVCYRRMWTAAANEVRHRFSGRVFPTECLLSFESAVAAALCRRTYSSSKVIHRWRGACCSTAPQPTVNNFGDGEKMFGEHPSIWLDSKMEHAGSGRRISHSNVSTFFWRLSLRDPAPCRKGTLRTLRLQVQTWQRRTAISPSIRQGRRAPQNQTCESIL
jgi:hypothetical protein